MLLITGFWAHLILVMLNEGHKIPQIWNHALELPSDEGNAWLQSDVKIYTLETRHVPPQKRDHFDRKCIIYQPLIFRKNMRLSLANSPSKYINYEVQRCFSLPKSDVAPENRPLKRRFLLETTIFRCYVSFREGCVFLFFLSPSFLGRHDSQFDEHCFFQLGGSSRIFAWE